MQPAAITYKLKNACTKKSDKLACALFMLKAWEAHACPMNIIICKPAELATAPTSSGDSGHLMSEMKIITNNQTPDICIIIIM